MRQIRIPIALPRLRTGLSCDASELLLKAFEDYIESDEFTRKLNHDEIKLSFKSRSDDGFGIIFSPSNWIGTVVDISYDDFDYLIATINININYDDELIDMIEKCSNAIPVLIVDFDYDEKEFKIINIPVVEVSAYIFGLKCETRKSYENKKNSYDHLELIKAPIVPSIIKRVKRDDPNGETDQRL